MRAKLISRVSFVASILGLACALPSWGQTYPGLKVAVGTDSVLIDSTGTAYYPTNSSGPANTCNATTCPVTAVPVPLPGGEIFANVQIDGFGIAGLEARTSPALPGTNPDQMDVGMADIFPASNGGVLVISYTVTGLQKGESPSTLSVVAAASGITQTYNTYVDNNNTPFGTGVTGPSGSAQGSYTGSGPSGFGSNGFSMTLVETLTFAAGSGGVNNDIQFSLPPLSPLSLSCSSATGTVGTLYNGLLVATGGQTPYTFSIISGSILPLTLNSSTGAITGTPTAAGPLSFTAEVVDSSGLPAADSTLSTSCAITIAPSSGGGSQGGGGGSCGSGWGSNCNNGGGGTTPTPLKVTCPTSTATVGVAYDSTVGVTGGKAPYTFAIVYGSLPAGLTLNTSTGEITGSPTTAGQTGAFKIAVTDSSSPPQTAYTNCSGSCSNGTTVSWGGSGNPQSGWGQKSWNSSYSSNNVQLNVYGWTLNGGHANLYSNNFGGQSYLGISNDQWGQNQIDSNHFVQCDFSDGINKGATGGSITLTGTGWGASFDIYGSNTLGQLGTLLQGNVQVNTWSQGGQSFTIPQFGKYKYICVKAHSGSSGGVSICNISCNFPCACAIDVSAGSSQGCGQGWGSNCSSGGSGNGGYGGGSGGQSGGSGSCGQGWGSNCNSGGSQSGGYGGGGYGGGGQSGGYGGGSGGQQGSGNGQCGW